MNTRTIRLVVAFVLAISLVATLSPASAQSPETPPPYHSTLVVPVDWSLVPRGMGPGDEFRLLFVTSGTRDATATDIATYNAFVQEEAAGGHEAIRPYSAHFRVLGATSAVDARVQTGTHPDDGGGVPIFWLNGREVADNSADLYDGSWVHPNPGRLPNGEALTFGQRTFVFTGIWESGETSQWPLGGGGLPEMPETRSGRPGGGRPLAATTVASSESHRFYALSGVFRVEGATPLQVGLEHIFTGELTADDGGEDLYRFHASAGTHYIIEVKAELVFDPRDQGAPSVVQPQLKDPSILRVENASGVQVLSERDQGGFTLNWARAFFAPATGGAYTVAVGSGHEDRGGFGRYTITVRADDHADDFRTNPAVVLRPGEAIDAVIESDVPPGDPRLNWWDWLTEPDAAGASTITGLRPRIGIEMLDDRDTLRFQIPERGNYRLQLSNAPENVGIWAIWDQIGNLWSRDLAGFVDQYTASFPAGTYYVEVGTPYESSGNIGPYVLSLREVPPLGEKVDCPSKSPTPCLLEVGRPKLGFLDGIADQDRWSVTLEAGTTYAASVRGAGHRPGVDDYGGDLEDPALIFYGPTGSQLADNDDIATDNRNARITYTVPTDAGGAYDLLVHRSTAGGETYTISIEEVVQPPLDEVVDCSAVQPATCSLGVGQSKRGRIEATTSVLRDIDAWEVVFQPNTTAVVEVKGAGDLSGDNDNGGSLPDPWVVLTNSEGVRLAFNDNVASDNRNAGLSLDVGPDDGGTYLLLVDGIDGHGTYTISFTTVE